MASQKKGKLIVVDGSDGSGKTTQAKLLIDALKKQKIKVKYMDFPRYYDSFFGETVGMFLRGEFGKIDEVSPYLASLTYALDRAAAKNEMDDFLKKGGFIVANRYATSNMGHQAAKFKNEDEKEKFLKWVYKLEYDVNKLPKEDIVFYLQVPWQISQKLTETREKKVYLKGKTKDIHEDDMQHVIDAENMYKSLAARYKHWVTIKCVENDNLLSVELIHTKLIETLKEKKYIK